MATSPTRTPTYSRTRAVWCRLPPPPSLSRAEHPQILLTWPRWEWVRCAESVPSPIHPLLLLGASATARPPLATCDAIAQPVCPCFAFSPPLPLLSSLAKPGNTRPCNTNSPMPSRSRSRHGDGQCAVGRAGNGAVCVWLAYAALSMSLSLLVRLLRLCDVGHGEPDGARAPRADRTMRCVLSRAVATGARGARGAGRGS